MAEVQQANTDIYKSLQTPKGMSLGEMLGIQKSQYELSRLKELYPAMISKEQALSKSAEIESRIKQKTEPFAVRGAEAEVLGKEATSNASQIDTMQKHFNNIVTQNKDLQDKKDLTKADIIKAYTKTWENGPGAHNPAFLKQTLAGLDGLPENPTKTQLDLFLTQNNLKTLTAQEAFEKQYPAAQLTNIGGKVVPITQGNPLIAVQQPGMQVGEGVKTGIAPTFVEINGLKYEYGPNKTLVPVGAGAGGGAGANAGGGEGNEKPVSIGSQKEIITGETPVVKAGGVVQYSTQQNDIATKAREEKNEIPKTLGLVGETDKSIDTALKTINSATGNVPGQLIRTSVKSVFGNAELEILKKSLADITLRQAKLMGAGTDQANADVASTQGNADLTVGALKSILERAKATNTAFKDYSQAISKYETKRGKDVADANHQQFKTTWSQNYDPNIFILQNIHESNKSEAEKELESKMLFKGMSKENIKKFKEKAQNIEALMKGEYK